eukprot:jgi/Botrbrau1/17464/Bobra.0054s0051.1
MAFSEAKDENQKLLRNTRGMFQPWFLHGIMVASVQYIQTFLNRMIPAPMRIIDLAIGGRVISHVVLCLTELNVPDALLKGPQTIEQLAITVGAQPDRLERVMRAAVHFGIFKEVHRRGQASLYCNNHLSASLCENHVQSQKYMILGQLGDTFKTMNSLTYGVQTGGNCYQHHTGRNDTFWDSLKENPEREVNFSRSMAAIDDLCWAALLADIKWSKWDKVTDIAGAYGGNLAQLLPAHPGMRGVLFDQPQVIERAKKIWAGDQAKAALLPRVKFVSGSFFEADTLPKAESSKEVYSMRLILHDWDDDDCVKILRSVRQAIGTSGASLLIIDTVLTPETESMQNHFAFMNDILMMTVLGAKERSPNDIDKLLARSGFKRTHIYQTRSVMTAVEACPV